MAELNFRDIKKTLEYFFKPTNCCKRALVSFENNLIWATKKGYRQIQKRNKKKEKKQ